MGMMLKRMLFLLLVLSAVILSGFRYWMMPIAKDFFYWERNGNFLFVKSRTIAL